VDDATTPLTSRLTKTEQERDAARAQRIDDQKRISELQAQLTAAQKLAVVPAQKSSILGLDDTKKWQFIKTWRDTSVDDRSSRLVCSTIMGVQPSPRAMGLYEEFYPLIFYSGWDATQGISVGPDEPFGIKLLIGGDNRNAFLCATRLSHMLQNISDVPITIKDKQITDALEKCNNECVQIEIGGGSIQ
jgi:hypothetical protein